MYTATKTRDTLDTKKGNRIFTIKFDNGTDAFERDFIFNIAIEITEAKKQIKKFLDELNNPVIELADGVVDFTDLPTKPTPTAAEQAEIDWWQDWNRLQTIERLIQSEILVGDEAPVVALKNKVKTNFKATYIA